MEKSSKKDLLSIIAKQDEDLKRYKIRFHDVVAAHKRLLKEKEALEASLKVLSRASSTTEIGNEDSDNISVDSGQTQGGIEKVNNSVAAGEPSVGINQTENLRAQLTTLMDSLSTLSEEKSRMEAGFQADRRQMRNEKEEKEVTIKELQKQLEQVTRSLQHEIESYKSKLIVERHQREKEHNDHGVMIRELQKLLAEERSTRCRSESATEEVKREFTAFRNAAERQEKELSNQLESLRRKQRREKDNSVPLLSTLQEEMAALKLQHSIAITREQERAAEAEERANKLAAMHEERVANLEAKLAELSQTVGSYDRLRQEDQTAILKLKERLVQLEIERGEEKSDTNIDTLVGQFQHLKGVIEAANNKSEKPLNIQSLLYESFDSKGYFNTDHSLCHEEYQRLKEEFDQYKKQATETIKAKDNMYSTNEEVDKLKIQLNNWKEKACLLRTELEETKAEFKSAFEQEAQRMKSDRLKWKEKLSSQETEFKAKLGVLDEQLSKQRERALVLVKEKEAEIESLKASFSTFIPARSCIRSHSSDLDNVESEVDTDLLGEGRHMLHYAQETARYQVDVAKLRKKIHRLETTLRDTQRAAAEERLPLVQKLSDLMETVDRLERCKSREGANLEYLKNVVLSYLLSTDSGCKAHMLNAIAAVLKFSDSEQQLVKQTSWYGKTV
uniref:GRIP domain-containing protein n=1 Tax=Clastoptera arizonana TaxID=38151 RepID=A0A1B6CLB2_9HEMI